MNETEPHTTSKISNSKWQYMNLNIKTVKKTTNYINSIKGKWKATTV